MNNYLDNEINKVRSLYHYYNKKSDLLSKCKAEVLNHELSNLKCKKKGASYNYKVRVFLDNHPEYKKVFK